MSKVISIVNQKGGVGKTTTTVNLGTALKNMGKKVLLIDMDSQADLTAYFGTYNYVGGISDAIDKALNANRELADGFLDAYKLVSPEGVSFIPSNVNLAGMEVPLQTAIGGELTLCTLIDTVREMYDYILIDCPPALSSLTINALAASDSVIIPVTPQPFGVKGLSDLQNTISLIQKRINKNLKIEGILFTLCEKNTNLTKQVLKEVREELGEYIPVFDVEIPKAVRVAESSASGFSLFTYDSKSQITLMYLKLAEKISATSGV